MTMTYAITAIVGGLALLGPAQAQSGGDADRTCLLRLPLSDEHTGTRAARPEWQRRREHGLPQVDMETADAFGRADANQCGVASPGKKTGHENE